MDPSEELDPYDLLEIPAELRPPTHYQLLGIDDFEVDLDTIAAAAKQRSAYLHQIAAGPHRKIVQQLMGEVAVARRTLLNEQTKEAYDTQLLADSEEYEQQQAAGQFQIDDEPKPHSAESAEKSKTAARTRRRKRSTWDEYKLHLASASILLTIVGIIWFVNRGSGERRAAQAGAARSSPVSPARTNSTKRRAPSLAAPAADRRAPVSRQQQRPKRSGGPSLAPSFDTDQYLKQEAPAMSKPSESNGAGNEPKKTGSAQANGAADKSIKLQLGESWKPEIKLVDAFDDKLSDRYQFSGDKTVCELQDGRILIQKAVKSRYAVLKSKKVKLKPGQAIAIDTNLPLGAGQGVQVGFGLGQARLALGSTKDHLQVRAKLANQKNVPAIPLGTLKPSAQPTTLVLLRSKDNPKKLHWIAKSGEEDISGQIIINSLSKSNEQVSIVFTAPEEQPKESIWIDNFRHGAFKNTPQWKPTEQIKL